MRKCRPRRGGIHQGVQKHKIVSRRSGGNKSIFGIQNGSFVIPPSVLNQLYKLANLCFNLYAKLDCKICLLPYDYDAEKELRLASTWKTRTYYLVFAIFTLSMLHKLAASIYCAITLGMDVATFICLSCFLIYLVGWSIPVSCHLYKEETMLIVNGWRDILAICGSSVWEDEDKNKTRKGSERIDDFKVAAMVIALAGVTLVVPLNAAMLSLVFPVPTLFYYDMAGALGIGFCGCNLSPIVWRVILSPLEFLTYFIALTLGAWAGMVFIVVVMETGACLDKLRSFHVDGMAARLQLRRTYMKLRVYHAAEALWIKPASVLAVFSTSATVVLCLYGTIQKTDLPLPIYAVYSYTWVACAGAMFWMCYEIIMVMRASEAIVWTLKSISNPYCFNLSRKDKMYLVKLGRGIRSLNYPFGDFMDISLDVPAGAFEEIINQLVFLLQL